MHIYRTHWDLHIVLYIQWDLSIKDTLGLCYCHIYIECGRHIKTLVLSCIYSGTSL